MTTKESPRGKRSATSEVEEFFAKRLEREEEAGRFAEKEETAEGGEDDEIDL